jgi:DNA adenine methylase
MFTNAWDYSLTPCPTYQSAPGQLLLFDKFAPDADRNVSAGEEAGPVRIARSTSRPLKWHGGKKDLANWIISRMPPRAKNANAPAKDDPGWVHYVEPYFGGGAVLFALDPDGISEVMNDLNPELTNFWDVLQSPVLFPILEHRLLNTPFSQIEFERSLNGHEHLDPVERAVAFFIRNRQSRQALGKDFATLARNRTRQGMNEFPSAWWSAVEGLPEFHARLRRVVILNGPALAVIRQQDGPRTLFYIDPPYLSETRSSNGEYGEFEMSPTDHRRLLETLAGIDGRFLLSGYRSDLYDAFAAEHGWHRHEQEVPLTSSSKKEKERRMECLWANYAAEANSVVAA